MPKISSSLRPFAENWLKSLESIRDPKQAIGTVRADCMLIGDQSSEVKYSDNRLISDEPKAIGGTSLGPSPLDYFIASIGFCENVTFARYATLNELNLDSLETSVRGHWNRRGQADSSDIEPAFIDFVVETRVISTDSVEKIKMVAMTAHRRCPMHSTITKVGKVVDKLFVNGVEVPLKSSVGSVNERS
jgi:uncharacterized OsmC-like protein